MNYDRSVKYIDREMAIFEENYSSDVMSTNSSITTDNYYNGDWEHALWKRVIEDFEDTQFTLSEPTTIVLITLYIPIFITSLIGNALVLLVIVPNRRMWSVTNNFLVNLAIADLLVTVLCMPMTVAGRVYRKWVYGDVLCKMSPYLQGVSVAVSTFTITAMSMDRCLAILYPMKFRNLRTKRNVRILISVVWVTSLFLMMPLLFVYKTKIEPIFGVVEITTCSEYWSSVIQRRAYDFSLLFVICLVPAQIVFVSYLLMGKRLWSTDRQLKGSEETKFIHTGSRSEKNGTDPIRANRRRIAKMCIVVSVVFVVCWLPYYTVNIYLDFKRDKEAVNIVYWGLLVGHLHCLTNPILYCYMHKTFRHCVMRLLPCWKSRFIRTQSGYGTQGYSKYRMGSLMASKRSSRCSSRKSPSPSTPQEYTPTRSRKSTEAANKSHFRFDTKLVCDKTEINSANVPNGEHENCDHKNSTPRKVQLLLSRFRDNPLCKSQVNSFKLIEVADSIKEEDNSKCQPHSETI